MRDRETAHRGWLLALSMALAATAPNLASAQADGAAQGGDGEADVPVSDLPGAREEARLDFELGTRYFDTGRYPEAGAMYERAYAAAPLPTLLYNAYLAYREAGMYADGIRVLSSFATTVTDPLRRAAIEGRLAALHRLEGQLHRSAPADRPPDDPPEAQVAETSAGGDDAAQAADAGGSPELAQGSPRSSDPPFGGWIMFGGGLALGGAAVVMLALAGAAADEVTGVEDGTPWVDVADRYDTSGSLSIAGAVLLGVGVAAAAGGLVWVLVGGGDDDVQVALTPFGGVMRGAW